MNPSGPSAIDIQSHLYSSFLESTTSDVALHVNGTWNAIYKLHRVVLIQSGFFRSMFTSGFRESSGKLYNQNRTVDEIDIVFDDCNITRSAFEICISRLYGGGPILHVPQGMLSSTSDPLTPSTWERQPSIGDIPPGHHPVTPRFLLSLLATSIYLSIPSVASQALNLILGSIGPYTVLEYLNFALGRSIDPRSSAEFPEAAVGLEHIAQVVSDASSSTEGYPESQHPLSVREDGGTIIPESIDIEELARIASPSDFSESEGSLEENEERDRSIGHHYGPVSNKIGEACACWLSRWAKDILVYESANIHGKLSITLRKRAKTFPSDNSLVTPQVSPQVSPRGTTVTPTIWSREGLSAKWVAALVSADTLFVRGERERYEFARAVVELRRRDGILESEEAVWTTMFEQGIYYSNMTIDDMVSVSQDISPITHRPFVSVAVIQAAHWNHSMLHHLITSRPCPAFPFQSNFTINHLLSSSSPSQVPTSPVPRDKELGIKLTTADIMAKITSSKDPYHINLEESKPYFPVPSNSSMRIGDGNNVVSNSISEAANLSMEQLFSSSTSKSASSPTTSNSLTQESKVVHCEGDFFGLLPQRHSGSTCVRSDPTGKQQWSPYPPYRFAVEFWDLDSLKDESRLYSHTIWYAGSLFNIYALVVRKKGQAQLGVYLHRQSSIDPIPASSIPSSLMLIPRTRDSNTSGARTREGHERGPSLPSIQAISPQTTHYSPSIHPISRSTTPLTSHTSNLAGPSSPSLSSASSQKKSPGPNTIPATGVPVAPHQPYRDPRSSISAYFSISCASAIGNSQTRFTSAPDTFNVSQSWGWKFSSSRTEEYVDIQEGGTSYRSDTRGKEVSLRATVVLGLV